MRHHQKFRTFGRKRKVRRALISSLVESLILREKIVTTDARAKELKMIADRLISRAKRNGVATRRSVTRDLGGRPSVVKKMFDTIAPRFKDRQGGYTRITKIVKRSSDGRQSSVIELV